MASMKDLNEEFYYNLMLAKALVQLLPANERQLIRIWFDKLAELDQSDEELTVRNEYVWFILLMLQNNKVLDHFKRLPPHKLEPLKDTIPQSEIEEVLIVTDQNLSWLDQVEKDDTDVSVDKRKVNPDNFLNVQPLPKEGIICYFGAFSDQQ